MHPDWSPEEEIAFFEAALLAATGQPLTLTDYQSLAGGNLIHAVRVDAEGKSYFIKWAESAPSEFFAAEAAGLAALRQTGALSVPSVLTQGQYQQRDFLVLPFLKTYEPTPRFWEQLGQGLALLHAHTNSRFGWKTDNFIGSLPQINSWQSKGIEFLVENRLRPQAAQAVYRGEMPDAWLPVLDELYRHLPDLIPNEKPALVHGDLWNGNVLCGPQERPYLIDPAVHYGHREADLAFTRLFGGFDDRFYAAYEEAFPLLPGFAQRQDLYNLYPLLVHVNLFGSGYLARVERILKKHKKTLGQ